MTSQISNRKSQIAPVPILAVIMARGGSIGLPNKALRPLLGKPVLAYTFDHAKESKLITRTILSSDDPAILRLGRESGIEILHRPPELATATSPTDPVLRHAVRTLYPPTKKTTENTEPRSQISNPKSSSSSVPSVSSVVGSVPHAVVMLYGNVPLRRHHMIDRCIQLLLESRADSVQTIAPVGKFHPYWMFDHTSDGKIKKHIPNNIFRRQDLPPLYSPTGAVYVIKTQTLMAAENNPDPHAFLGQDRRGLIVSPEDSVDIDSEKDLYLAEALLKSHPDETTETRRHGEKK